MRDVRYSGACDDGDKIVRRGMRLDWWCGVWCGMHRDGVGGFQAWVRGTGPRALTTQRLGAYRGTQRDKMKNGIEEERERGEEIVKEREGLSGGRENGSR